MTLPEHVICSVMLAQFGVRQRWGWRGVAAVVAAGVAPDLDTAAKLVRDDQYWRLHHALGHSIISLAVLSAVIALSARWLWRIRPAWLLGAWCFIAAGAHVFTDVIYWWGVKFFWPISHRELRLDWIEYLDLIVLGLWLAGAVLLYWLPHRGVSIAAGTLGLFVAYLTTRALLPRPPDGSWMHLLTGGWMYVPAKGTPLLDWW